jgi:hypothetical protein
MHSAGREPVIPATKRPQTYVLHRLATGIGAVFNHHKKISQKLAVDFRVRSRLSWRGFRGFSWNFQTNAGFNFLKYSAAASFHGFHN